MAELGRPDSGTGDERDTVAKRARATAVAVVVLYIVLLILFWWWYCRAGVGVGVAGCIDSCEDDLEEKSDAWDQIARRIASQVKKDNGQWEVVRQRTPGIIWPVAVRILLTLKTLLAWLETS